MTTDPLNKALDFVLRHEGGFVDHPNDPGGATNMGISLRFLREQASELADVDGDGDVDADDIRALTKEQARELYVLRFWKPLCCDELPGPLAMAVFDTGVNMGTGRAAKLLQRVVGATEDGIIGPKTLAAVRAAGGQELVSAYLEERLGHYLRIVGYNPRLSVFMRGWENRVRHLEEACGRLA